MFGKSKKTNNDDLKFKSENYKMTDTYKTEDLVIGNLQYVSSKYTNSGPMMVTTKQKYVFEKIDVEGKIKYREVFTGFIADTDSNYFDLPYIVNIKPIKETIKNIAETLPKYGLLLVIDEINKIENNKQNIKVMTKKKRRR